jgi:hypothetical protein
MLRHSMRHLVAGILSVTILGLAPIAQADRRPYAVPFTPEWAAPQLDASPYGGPPGTEVEISGHKFNSLVRVFYGDQPMFIVQRGKDFIVAVIPQYVRHDDFIYVMDSTGRARTRLPFDVLARRHDHWHHR